MHIEIIKGNIFESNSEAIILTVDGLRKGMEGNIARAFERHYPDAWEELEYEFEYPIPLGSSKIYEIDSELGCKNKYCILAATLHHIGILEKSEKLKVISAALRNSLSLATRYRLTSVCSIILSGGWRLQLDEAFAEMLKTYKHYKATTIRAPILKIYILGAKEYTQIEEYLAKNNVDFNKLGHALIA